MYRKKIENQNQNLQIEMGVLKLKKKKATCADIPAYITCQRVRRVSDGLRGWRYVLENSNQDEINTLMNLFKNVTWSTCTYRYAPEIQHYTITLWDKCIR